MTTYTTHTDAEAQGLHDGRITLIVVPCKDQPVGNESAVQIGGKWHMGRMRDSENAWREMEMPYSIGQRVGVKEACYIAPWKFCAADQCNAIDSKGRPRYVGYASDMDCDSVRCATDYDIHKIHASKMPLWAIRTHFLIESIEARLVRTITEEEAKAFFWRPCPKMNSFSGLHYEQICGDRDTDARWLGPLIDEWNERFPKYSFESSWAWFIAGRKVD